MSTIIIITPPPPPPPGSGSAHRAPAGKPDVTVLSVDVLEDASTAEILHAALSGLDPDAP